MSDASHTEPQKVNIRAMRESDLLEVLDIDRQSFTMPWPASAYDYELNENQSSMLWVAETIESEGAQKVIGMIVVWFIIDEAHIATIAVHPDYRERGIARKLLTTAIQEVIHQGFRIATLEVRAHNTAARNLYDNFGFQVVGSRPRYYRDNNEDALIMTVKDLDESYLEWLMKNDSKSNLKGLL